MTRNALPLALLLLAACGREGPVENTAEQLEEAADQSGQAAAEVLEDAADEVREQNQVAPIDAPRSTAQEALREAGEAQVENTQ